MKIYSIIFSIIFLASCCPRPVNLTNKYVKKEENLTTEKTYRTIKSALKKPDKVVVLDLSGQGLTKLPADMVKLKNLKFLDLGDKPKNLLFKSPYIRFKYCKVGGGLRHFDRMTGKYYNTNYIKDLPNELHDLPNLKVIRLSGNQELNQEDVSKLKEKGIKII